MTAHAWRSSVVAIALGLGVGAGIAGWMGWRSLAAIGNAQQEAVTEAPSTSEQETVARQVRAYLHLKARFERHTVILSELGRQPGLQDFRAFTSFATSWAETAGVAVGELRLTHQEALVALHTDDPRVAVELAREILHRKLLCRVEVRWTEENPAVTPARDLAVSGELYRPSAEEPPTAGAAVRGAR